MPYLVVHMPKKDEQDNGMPFIPMLILACEHPFYSVHEAKRWKEKQENPHLMIIMEYYE